MRSKSLTKQSGSIRLQSARGAVRRAKELAVEDHLNGLHGVWNLLHSSIHSQAIGPKSETYFASAAVQFVTSATRGTLASPASFTRNRFPSGETSYP